MCSREEVMDDWSKFGKPFFDLRLTDPTFERNCEPCWQNLIHNYEESRGASIYRELIACVFEELREYIEGLDWECREAWTNDGGSETAYFVRDVLSRGIAYTIDNQASAFKEKIHLMMRHRKVQHTAVWRYLAGSTMLLKTITAARYDTEAREFGEIGTPIGGKAGTHTDSTGSLLSKTKSPSVDFAMKSSHEQEYTIAGHLQEVSAPGIAVEQTTKLERRAAVRAFMQRVFDKTGRRVIKKDIWTVAGYSEATEFERFQRNDPHTTRSAVENIDRVLSMKPGDFIQKWEIMRAKKKKVE